MIQILGLIVAVMAVVMGIKTIAQGEIALTKDKPLTGTSATIAGVVVILIGLALGGFLLVGLPLLMGL